MAELTGKVISELPEATIAQDSDLLPVSQNAASKRMTVETLLGRAMPIFITVNISAASSSQQIGSATDARINANTRLVRYEIANPSYRTSEWTVTTYDDAPQVRITGTCAASTTVNLLLAESN